jgi:integrase
VVFWRTKGDYPRGVDLPRRVRDALAERGEGAVFRNSRGEAWHGYDAINLMLRRHREARPDLSPAHCHLFRHTWATWAYACTRDLTFVAQSGGWRSLGLLGRYTHAASPDLARAVLSKGWEYSGREIYQRGGKSPRKPRKHGVSPP